MAKAPVKPIVQFGLYVLLASIPFELPAYRGGFPIEVPTLTGALFLLTALAQPRRSFGQVPRPVWWFFGWLCVFAIATTVNFLNDAFEVLQYFLLVFEGVLVFWAAANLLDDATVASGALVSFAGACLLRAALPIAGIGRMTTKVWTGGVRITAFGQNENNAAIFLSAGLVALLGLAYFRSRPLIRPRLLAIPGCALIAFSVLETASRGGLAALVAGLSMFLLSRGQSAWQRLRNGAIAAVVLLGLVWASLAIPVMRNRLRATEESGAMAGREDLYPILVQMFVEKPILGWGPQNNHYELSLREGNRFLIQRDTHNLVLEVLTNTGLVGAFFFCIPLWLCWRAAWRARASPEGVLPLALMACVMMGNMSGNWISSKLLWLTLAYAVASERRVALAPSRTARLANGVRSPSAVV